jgi:hypothetical protein
MSNTSLPPEERVSQSFAAASDLVKQILTLSTAILTLTITFRNDVIQDSASPPTSLLVWSWILYIVSIVFGVASMMALAGELAQDDRPSSIAHGEVRWFPVLQILSFLAATILIVIFGTRVL